MKPNPILPSAAKVIGIDFDNTIISYDDIMHSLALERKFINSSVPKNKKEVRDTIRKLPEGDLKWQQIQAEAYGRAISGAVIHAGVKEFLSACKKQKIPVYIVSHKTEYSNLYKNSGVNLREAALSWMQKHLFQDAQLGLTAKQVFFESTREEKIKRLHQLGCTHFIDDLMEIFSNQNFPQRVQKILYADHSEPRQEVKKNNVLALKDWREIHEHFFT